MRHLFRPKGSLAWAAQSLNLSRWTLICSYISLWMWVDVILLKQHCNVFYLTLHLSAAGLLYYLASLSELTARGLWPWFSTNRASWTNFQYLECILSKPRKNNNQRLVHLKTSHEHFNSIRPRKRLGCIYDCVLIKPCSKLLGAMETETLCFSAADPGFGPYFIFHSLSSSQ